MGSMRWMVMAATLLAATAHGTSCRVESGPRLRPLIELYTSEGCSSCPPADRWLSDYFQPGAVQDAIPLAFHVDYWDRLGWSDRFASPGHTDRQYQAMRANLATFVYTPQVVLQGRDYPGWRRARLPTAIAGVGAHPARADITLAVEVGASALQARASVRLAQAPTGATIVALAYADSGLTSAVRSGENRGEKLRHDHVVRVFRTQVLAGATDTFEVRLPHPDERGTHPTVVAFVQDTAGGDVFQSVALALADCPAPPLRIPAGGEPPKGR